ncbi:MAG: hypothetical protein AVDCRST_MAG41-3469 [uncultured Corynebacteriales bacterium]|uniref:Uncharacterized protein n=1 Tax=uncultured Mycobacteriales bacterium TaxID=581187 RepID=A0A6J4JJX7_9ACTN|nr:MAG: hypothetical protein AVDCRST_MAG41-3469 [uncultured Corynebacteriales bacterium]
MALSTRARIAGLGGAVAIGLLGAGGVAYAAGGGATDTPTYVTVVDEGTTPATPATPGERSGKDCPEGTGSGSGARSGSQSGTDAGDA